MKKTILGMALVAMSMVAVPVFAQKSNDKVCTEQCSKQMKDQKPCCKPGEGKQHCHKAPKGACAFEGLNLTDAQKQQLQTIATPGKRVAEQQKAERAERMNRAKAARENYLKDVKAVLTPEQYVQFLENNFVNHEARPGKANKNKHPKGMRPGNHVQKGDQAANRPAGPSINAKGKRSAEN